MKRLFTFVLIISAFSSTSEAYASKVFKCVNEDGKTTFTYVACPERSDKASVGIRPAQSVEEQMAKIDRIENEVAHLNRKFRDLRLEFKSQLETDLDATTQQQLLNNYQLDKTELRRRLSSLKSERSKLVESSMSLLSQAS